MPRPQELAGHSGENRSVHEFLAKIARLALSKGAAFCYAVTVGVSGQLAYNYLQPRNPAPKPVPSPCRRRPPRPPSGRPFRAIPARRRPNPGRRRRTSPAPGCCREAGIGPARRDRADPAGAAVIVAADPGGAARPRAETDRLAAEPAGRRPRVEPSPAPVEPAEKPAVPIGATLSRCPIRCSPTWRIARSCIAREARPPETRMRPSRRRSRCCPPPARRKSRRPRYRSGPAPAAAAFIESRLPPGRHGRIVNATPGPAPERPP